MLDGDATGNLSERRRRAERSIVYAHLNTLCDIYLFGLVAVVGRWDGVGGAKVLVCRVRFGEFSYLNRV